MVRLEIVAGSLVLHVVGLDQLWSFKSQLTIPLVHVQAVQPVPNEAKQWFHGLRAPGTNIPGVIVAGTYYDGNGCAFWDVHDAENAIEISLHDERFKRLVVEVEDPAASIALLRDAISRSPAQSDE